MDRKQCLDAAAACVLRDRQTQHGKPENTFARIAAMWTAYVGVLISPHDVAAMMVLLKVARLRENPGNDDNWVDVAGYAACGSEVRDERVPEES